MAQLEVNKKEVSGSKIDGSWYRNMSTEIMKVRVEIREIMGFKNN
jgi:hypothetical protein